jgi:hypothetical protein
LQTYGLKHGLIIFIADPISQGKIKGIIFSFHNTNVLLGFKYKYSLEIEELTLSSPVPGKYSPYLWKLTVITLSVV